MPSRTRSVGDLMQRLLGGERAATSALLHAVGMSIVLGALAAATAVAAAPTQSATQDTFTTASSITVRPSPAARPSPGESTLVVVSDDDANDERSTKTQQYPAGNWITAIPQDEDKQQPSRRKPQESSSLFSGLPTMQAPSSPVDAPVKKQAQPSPPAASSSRSPILFGNNSILGQLFSGHQVAPKQAPATSAKSADGWFDKFAGTWPFGSSAARKPSPGETSGSELQGAASSAADAASPVQAAASDSKPHRLPTVTARDEGAAGLWKQLTAQGGAASPSSGGDSGKANAQRGSAVTSAPAGQPPSVAAAEAVSGRVAGLVHQFTAANNEPPYFASTTGPTHAVQAAGGPPPSAATGGTDPQENPWSDLWSSMTTTRVGHTQAESLLAESSAAKNDPKSEAESPTPSLLLPFYLTNSNGPSESTVASSSGRRSGAGPRDSSAPLSLYPGPGSEGAFPVAYLEDASGEPLPRPPKDPDDRLVPEDLGIPGAESKPAADGDDKEESLAEAESLGEEPEDNSLQFLRSATVLLKPGQRQCDIGLTYTFSQNEFPVLLTDGGEIVGVDEAQFRTRELDMPIEMRFGLLKRVQMFVGADVGWSNTELTVDTLEAFKNDGGLGDIYGGLTIQFRDATECRPYLIGSIGFIAPTGGDPFSTAAGLSPSGPSLGSGFWSVFGNLLWVRPYDPVTVFYGLGVKHSFEKEYVGLDLKPGNEYSYVLGVGFAVNEKMTLSTRFRGSYVEELDVDGQRIPGTILEPMSVRLAATIAQEKHIVEPFVDFGVTEDSSNAYFGIIWTY